MKPASWSWMLGSFCAYCGCWVGQSGSSLENLHLPPLQQEEVTSTITVMSTLSSETFKLQTKNSTRLPLLSSLHSPGCFKHNIYKSSQLAALLLSFNRWFSESLMNKRQLMGNGFILSKGTKNISPFLEQEEGPTKTLLRSWPPFRHLWAFFLTGPQHRSLLGSHNPVVARIPLTGSRENPPPPESDQIPHPHPWYLITLTCLHKNAARSV